MKQDRTRIVLLIFLLLLIIWMVKKLRDEMIKGGGDLENMGIPFSWPGEFHPPAFTPARLWDNMRNLFTAQWWAGLWQRAGWLTYSDPESNQLVIDTWIMGGATAEKVLLDKVNTGYFTELEGYQWLQEMYAPAFMDYRLNMAAEFAATQLEIYANTVNLLRD